MAKGQRISPLVLQEAFASGDDAFLDYLRQTWDAKVLVPLVQRWVKDFRPWARAQVFRYLDLPLDAIGHNIVVKRMFWHYEKAKDDEAMGAFMAAFDRLIRRRRKRRMRWNEATGRAEEAFVLVSPSDETFNLKHLMPRITEGSVAQMASYYGGAERRLFSKATRYYLRRRAWRYFRSAGHGRAGDYPRIMAGALARYRDDDLKDGLAVLDSWGLFHACFGKADGVEFTYERTRLTRAMGLPEMVAPYFPELWRRPDAAPVLLRLVTGAGARVVRMWSITMVRREHMTTLQSIAIEELLRLIEHPDSEVQQLGGELFENATGLDQLDVETWLRLLQVENLTVLASIASAMRKHVKHGGLNLDQMLTIASASPVPVARLGLEFLRERGIGRADRAALARLAAAQSEGVGREVAAFALSILGTPDAYDADIVSRFFDSLVPTIRQGAWEWLTDATPGWNDAALWSRLIETPYDDVRVRLVAALELRSRKPNRVESRAPSLPGIDAAGLAALWCPVLLAVHRGGRAKLAAMRQIGDALRVAPEHAEALLPVIAVALRSVRLPEARGGLAAVVAAVEARPELEPLVRRHLPELVLEPAMAAGGGGGAS